MDWTAAGVELLCVSWSSGSAVRTCASDASVLRAASVRLVDLEADHPHEGQRIAALDDAAWLLLDQARILEGEALPDPAAFARRLSAVVERGIKD